MDNGNSSNNNNDYNNQWKSKEIKHFSQFWLISVVHTRRTYTITTVREGIAQLNSSRCVQNSERNRSERESHCHTSNTNSDKNKIYEKKTTHTETQTQRQTICETWLLRIVGAVNIKPALIDPSISVFWKLLLRIHRNTQRSKKKKLNFWTKSKKIRREINYNHK